MIVHVWCIKWKNYKLWLFMYDVIINRITNCVVFLLFYIFIMFIGISFLCLIYVMTIFFTLMGFLITLTLKLQLQLGMALLCSYSHLCCEKCRNQEWWLFMYDVISGRINNLLLFDVIRRGIKNVIVYVWWENQGLWLFIYMYCVIREGIKNYDCLCTI